MRIVHIHLSEEFAGSEQYAASLAAEQARAGDAVMLIVRRGTVDTRWIVEAHPAQVVFLPTWVPSVLETFAIAHLLKGFGPDVVHTHLGRANIKGGKAARKLKCPWVATLHLRYKKKEMEKANGLICIAGWQQQEVWEGGFTGKSTVVWNWLARTAQNQSEKNFRGMHKVPQGAMVLGSVGRLHRQKGFDVLIRAFRKAFEDKDNVYLMIAGRGNEHLHLQGLAGPDKRIIFLGYQEDMPAVYNSFNAYVSASVYEPFGLTILEAMSHKLPIICTETAGPREFLSNHSKVEWVRPHDETAMTEALMKAFTQFRKNQLQPIDYDMTRFEPTRAVAQIKSFYQTLVKA